MNMLFTFCPAHPQLPFEKEKVLSNGLLVVHVESEVPQESLMKSYDKRF